MLIELMKNKLYFNNNIFFKIKFVFYFVLFFSNLNAQQLTYSTFSNFSFDTNVGSRYIMETTGEAISGLRKDGNYVFIEGFYATEEYQIPDSDQSVIVTHLTDVRDNLKIYPNPVKDKFYIENGLKHPNLKICIYNLRGILVKSFFYVYHYQFLYNI